MTLHNGYYSLIQYCPDASRAEAANVGVLLFCPELNFIEARTATDHGRVTQFFGKTSFDPGRLTAAKRAVEDSLKLQKDRFRALTDLQRFIATRVNDIIVTDPRPVKVADPARELDELFTQLVGGRAHVRRSATIPELDREMRAPQLQGRVRFDTQVVVPVIGTTMKIPYAFENGQPNLIRPTPFQTDEASAVRQAVFLACAGEMLRDKSDVQGRKSQLIVVSASRGRHRNVIEQIEQHVQHVFDEYAIPFYRRAKVGELIERVNRDAHPVDAGPENDRLLR